MSPEPSRDLPHHAFANRFDEALARRGPPAVFSVDADGELRLSPDRTREVLEAAAPDPLPDDWCHCLVQDAATGWVQYLLLTSPALIPALPRCAVKRYPTQAAAHAALARLGPLPLAPATWADEGL